MRSPNILFIISDDHAKNAVGCYGSRFGDVTPNIDRIAAEGVRLDSFCNTNALCSPSRACILTGAYGHINGVVSNQDRFDSRQDNIAKRFQAGGYQTALFGKWHLGHGDISDPSGFDTWKVLPEQGDYFDPEFLTPEGCQREPGYVTDLITDGALDWLAARDADRPFFLWVAHKAPHRCWEYDEAHAGLFEDEELAIPETLFDNLDTRGPAAQASRMRLRSDLKPGDLHFQEPPAHVSDEDRLRWIYQAHLKNYLRVCASMDDNIGRMLDWLEDQGLAEDTVVVYTSDHGLFLGEHGWFDKRFMYEEALGMPFVIRHPGRLPAGRVLDDLLLNIDIPSTLLELAGLPPPALNQGCSFLSRLRGETEKVSREAVYYRYWCHRDYSHSVFAHRGIRTQRHKLIHFYNAAPGIAGARDERDPPFYELYDLQEDPKECRNLAELPAYAGLMEDLRQQMERLARDLGDPEIQ